MICRARQGGTLPWKPEEIPVQGAANCNRQLQQQEHTGKRWIRKRLQGQTAGRDAGGREEAQGRKRRRRGGPVPDRSGNDKLGGAQEPAQAVGILHDCDGEAPRLSLHGQWQRRFPSQRYKIILVGRVDGGFSDLPLNCYCEFLQRGHR